MRKHIFSLETVVLFKPSCVNCLWIVSCGHERVHLCTQTAANSPQAALVHIPPTPPDLDLSTGNRPKHDHLLSACVCVLRVCFVCVCCVCVCAAHIDCNCLILSLGFGFAVSYDFWHCMQFICSVNSLITQFERLTVWPVVSLFSYHCKNVCPLLKAPFGIFL